MRSIAEFVKRRPQAIFWVINWTLWFAGWFFASKYPSDLWFLFIYFPFLTGALLSGMVDGRDGLRTYFGRMARWSVGIQWYAVALFLPLILRLVAAGLNVASGASLAADLKGPAWTEIASTFVFPSFFLIALGEEPGFRGFALPRLLAGRSALAAALILGVLHAIWHLPLFIFGSDSPLVVAVVVAGAVLNTWLFNHTNGSVLLAMLLHASINTMVGVFNPLFTGLDADRHLVWQAVVFVAFAVLLAVLTGKELGRRPETAAA